MVLVDTSIWIDHLRRGEARLSRLLEKGRVLCHPWVIGELACGRLERRTEILDLLEALPLAEVAEHRELLDFIERRDLMGRSVGFVDVHLLGSALLSHAPLWTGDRALACVAADLGVSYGEDE